MSNTLYLECYSGISGDMMVAALLDLGADQNVLEKALKSIPAAGFAVEVSRVKKAGLDACDFRVVLDQNAENHDHDMDYLHGEKAHDTETSYEHGREETIHSHETTGHEHKETIHSHEENNMHIHETHAHEHRGLSEIIELIEQTEITKRAKELAKRIFRIIAEAEAKAHGVELNQVHFHEVGAIDSIVDIVAVAVCIDNMCITDVIVPELYEGRGFVRCQHGMIPIPVPAVANIVIAGNLQLHITSTEGELVTPTGAAIVAAIKTADQLPDKFSIEKIGIGAGKRTYDRPSLLRAMLIKDKTSEVDEIYKLESNIDDCSGELLGFVMDRLFEAGARDVHYTPVYMKKNRPAYQVNVICKKEDIKRLEQIIFEETTTIGTRRVQMERTVLQREIKTVLTSLGEAQVKICTLESGKRIYPEYSSIVELCKKHQMEYQAVFRLVQKECEESGVV